MRTNATLLSLAMVLSVQSAAFAMAPHPPRDTSYLQKLQEEGAVSLCKDGSSICSMKAEELAKAADLMDREGVPNYTICAAAPETYGAQPETPKVARWVARNAEAYYKITREGWRAVEPGERELAEEAVRAGGDKTSFSLKLHFYVSPKVAAEMESMKADRRAQQMEDAKKNFYQRLEEDLTGGLSRLDGR